MKYYEKIAFLLAKLCIFYDTIREEGIKINKKRKKL